MSWARLWHRQKFFTSVASVPSCLSLLTFAPVLETLLQHPSPLRGAHSGFAQYSNTPSLRAAGFEDENDDENEYEAPREA
jgi:hypothetical protein